MLDSSLLDELPDVMADIPDPDDIIPATLSTSLISFTFAITVSVMDAVSSIDDPCGILTVIVICVLSILGIKELPMFIAPITLPTNKANVTVTTIILRFNSLVITFRYNSCNLSIILLSFSVTLLSTPADIIGTNVTATIKLATSEYPIVSPISTNNCFVSPVVNTIGRNTEIVVNVDDVIAPATPFAPVIAASLTGTPSFLSR